MYSHKYFRVFTPQAAFETNSVYSQQTDCMNIPVSESPQNTLFLGEDEGGEKT